MRIYFTPDDLLRIRFAEEPAPLLELSMAMASLHRPGSDPVLAGGGLVLGGGRLGRASAGAGAGAGA